MKLVRWPAAVVVLALMACSSGGDSGTPPSNDPPTITFATPALVVTKNIPVDLTVTATDPDGDALTITWEITRGTLTAQNAKKTVMRWSTPSTVGTDTVSVRVSDGSVSTSVIAVIKVGTLFTQIARVLDFVKAESPYILRPSSVDPRVTIQANDTVVIEAGTELYMDTEGGYFSVLGELEAHGTADEPIVIRPNNRTFVCSTDRGWWEGIRAASDDALNSDGFLDFEFVEIWYGENGIRLNNKATALLRDCVIRCSGSAGISCEGSGSLRVFDSRISDGANDGIAIAAISSVPDSVRVDGCVITFNGNAGIRMDLQDLAQSVPIVVEYNAIEFNDAHGISLAHAVFPQIHYNAFRGNGDNTVSNLFLVGGYPAPETRPELNAACNFWGSAATNPETIDASIRDSWDTNTVGTRVISSPWLNASPITTPPNCTP